MINHNISKKILKKWRTSEGAIAQNDADEEFSRVLSYPLSDNGAEIYEIPEYAEYYKVFRKRIMFSGKSFRQYKRIPEGSRYVEIDSEKHCYTIERCKRWIYEKDL